MNGRVVVDFITLIDLKVVTLTLKRSCVIFGFVEVGVVVGSFAKGSVGTGNDGTDEDEEDQADHHHA